MRHLIRLDKPQKLVDNEEAWTEAFLNSSKTRPNNTQYAHKDIKNELGRISHYKCFYSEVKFANLSDAQVDHYIEVSEDRTKAFDWSNLYLSHKDSNLGKPSNKTLPNASCLDPFTDQDSEIERNLDFEDEIMIGKTEKGLNTIQKYNLNKPIYNALRTKELKKFTKITEAIAYHGLVLDENLKETLRRYANPDQPFSLMFKKLLTKHKLL